MSRAENQTPPPKSYFESLDLIRGLAAIVVLVYHADFMFGLRGELLRGGYLAVDLFFILSGFVLSHTYGERIAKGRVGFCDYLVARLARLYPLFLATTFAGFFIMTARFRANFGYIDTVSLVKSGLLNIFMLPSFSNVDRYKSLFPFNGATWSIFFEMIASLLFFVALARLATRWLVFAVGAAGLWLAATVVQFSTVDLGWGTTSFIAGFPRVLFSFLVGMLIHRGFVRYRWRVPPLVLYAVLAVALALVQLRAMVSGPSGVLFDGAMLAVVLPALVAAGAGSTLGRRGATIARVLGEASYSVYLLQGSMIIVAAGLAQALTGVKIADLGAWVGFAFVAATIALSFVTFHVFEDPARRWLRRMATGGRADKKRDDIVSVHR